jgi:hypothetical protein
MELPVAMLPDHLVSGHSRLKTIPGLSATRNDHFSRVPVSCARIPIVCYEDDWDCQPGDIRRRFSQRVSLEFGKFDIHSTLVVFQPLEEKAS